MLSEYDMCMIVSNDTCTRDVIKSWSTLGAEGFDSCHYSYVRVLHRFCACVQRATIESQCRCRQQARVTEIIYFWQGVNEEMMCVFCSSTFCHMLWEYDLFMIVSTDICTRHVIKSWPWVTWLRRSIWLLPRQLCSLFVLILCMCSTCYHRESVSMLPAVTGRGYNLFLTRFQ